jgi:RsiW-degrading membrane proteinase PrsW (M82 family)
VVLSLLANTLLMVPIGLVDADVDFSPGPSDPWFALAGGLCSLPLLLLVLTLRRPKLTHVVLADPSSRGKFAHQLPGGRVLSTSTPTVLSHHLIRRSPPLDLPRPAPLVALFVGSVLVVLMVLVPLGLLNAGLLQALAFALLFLPAWMIGFSIPVFAWWAVSSEVLHLPTDRRQGESMLIAGMLSGFPAIAVNSLLFPMVLVALGVTSPVIIEGLTLVVSAPVGEELCKLAAVLLLGRLVDSGRRGLQAGFTVGLGFAMIENLQYILASLLADPTTAAFGFGFTSVLRGVGSIPGHAVWTGLGGYALGCTRASSLRGPNDLDEGPSSPSAEWGLFEAHTGRALTPSTSVWSVRRERWTGVVTSTRGPAPPTNVVSALLMAIAFHAAWNGTSLVMSMLVAESVAGFAFMLVVDAILILAVLHTGRRLFGAAMMQAGRASGVS